MVGDEFGVQYDGAAPDAVTADHLVKAGDLLAAQDFPLDDPIDRAAAKDFISPFRPHAGDVSSEAVSRLRARCRLPRGKVGDPFGANGQFLHM